MTRLMLLASATIAGLSGMFVVDGAWKTLFFLLAASPALIGAAGYIGQARRRR